MYTCETCQVKFNKSHHYNYHLQTHMDNQNFLEKYIKYSFDEIEYINNVPKVVFVCWFGGYKIDMPLMKQNRFNCFKNLVSNIEIPIILITHKNYKCFVKNDFPLHKAFQYLTGNHKTDYFKCYLMHHYGGACHDIKSRILSWKNEWEKDNWLYDDNIWMYGRIEKNENVIGYPPEMKHIKKEFNKLVTMGWIICKNHTQYTSDLLNNVTQILEDNCDKLLKFPGVESAGYRDDNRDMAISYPLRWLQVMGEIFHPLMITYCDHIKFGLPDANKSKKYK